MEFIKNISFNTDKLLKNTKVKVIYSGKLFEDNSESVFIHYGFNSNWDNVSDIKMDKTDIGFQTEIDLLDNDILNFCFRNSNEIWDNNNENNYSFPIEKIEEEIVEIKEEEITNTINENLVTSIALYNEKNVILKFFEKVGLAVIKTVKTFPKIVGEVFNNEEK